jgi:beta-lactamase class D
MRYLLLILCFFSFSASIFADDSFSAKFSNVDFKQRFKGYNACFVINDMKNNKYYFYNKQQCNEMMTPCSTFKILNSLIGLQTRVLKDENTMFKWDGTKYPIESWNQDHTLKSAIANSVVWYYKKVAAEVGEKRMQEYLDKVGYGNKDISGGITRFWLHSTLLISPLDQVKFLTRLYREKLPFSKRNMEIVKSIIILKKEDNFTFSGKTGSAWNTETSSYYLGWFLGYVNYDGHEYTFCANIRASADASGPKAKELCILILKDLGLYK